MSVQQQINLYQPIFRKQEKVFSARTMLLVFVVTIIFFSAIYGYARWNVSSLVTQSDKLAVSYQSEIKRLENLTRLYPVKQKNKKVELELEEIKKERKAKLFLVKTLSSRSLGNEDGFSVLFEAMARQRPQGMWLQRFEIEKGGQVIGLHGSSLQPELVPEFLQSLSEESSFDGSNFRIFRIQRDANNKAAVNFTLRSVAVGTK